MPDWTNPRVEIEAALRDNGQAGVMRAFSAFDLFLDARDRLRETSPLKKP